MRRLVIRFSFGILVSLLCLSACKSGEEDVVRQEDLNAKQMLQGIWMDDDSDLAFMRIAGDTLYYADSESLPVKFFIMDDSLYVVGSDTVSYFIVKQTPNLFNFKMIDGTDVHLYKSDSEEDEMAFAPVTETLPSVQERLEKDSVVMYAGQRYRGYVYVNPSTMKVYKQSVNSAGMVVDNVYYDNIIHICVYTGTQELYGKDITKNLFADYLPDGFLEGAILADMDFVGVDSEGFHYSAKVSQPESPLYYQFLLTIDENKELLITEE